MTKKEGVVGCTRFQASVMLVTGIIFAIIGLIVGVTCFVVHEQKVEDCKDKIMETTATINMVLPVENRPWERQLQVTYPVPGTNDITSYMIISCSGTPNCNTILEDNYNVGNIFKIYYKDNEPSKPYQSTPDCDDDYIWLKVLYVLGFGLLIMGTIMAIVSTVMIISGLCMLKRHIITEHYELADGQRCTRDGTPLNKPIIEHRYIK